LPFNRPAVLPQDLETAPAFELAGFHIQQDLQFPWQERVPVAVPPHHVGEQPIEAVEHDLELFQVLHRHPKSKSAVSEWHFSAKPASRVNVSGSQRVVGPEAAAASSEEAK
jgi:hypothetical protein